jgi:hypothetical protein
MTLLDGHGRTPHDTLEQTQSAVVMLCCLPCLCVVACIQSVVSGVQNAKQHGRMKEQTRSNGMGQEGKVELDAVVPSDEEAKTSSNSEGSVSEPKAKDMA